MITVYKMPGTFGIWSDINKLSRRGLAAETGNIQRLKKCLTSDSSVTILVTVMAANSQFSMAVHVLTMLAQSCDENVKSDYLAGSVNTNPVVVRRLLGQLNQAKLVVSQTGSAGGTRLARCPNEINLAEVYHAVSCGEVFALHAKSPSQDCPVGKNIEAVLCGLQKEIDRSVSDTLSRHTLKDVIDMIEHGDCTSQGKVSEPGKVFEQGQV